MKIFGIMLVKNEVDIVGYVLKKAQEWCDKIFILDNGSTDGTWELIQSMKNDCITPWKQDFGPFRRGMRADVFNEFRHLSEPGDWWCYALDADEVYAEDPREFLAKIPNKYLWVFKQDISFRLTREDLSEYSFSGLFEEDIDKLKYFAIPCWSEGRFFRYRKNLKWDNGIASQYPLHVGIFAPQRILVKHYARRSPQQIESRIQNRTLTKQNDSVSAWKCEPETLEEALRNRSELVYFDGDLQKIKKLPVLCKEKQNPIKNFIKRVLITLGLYN